jgi:chromosome transmission fidelity protein 4
VSLFFLPTSSLPMLHLLPAPLALLLLGTASTTANDSAIRGSISLSQLRDSQADEHTIKQREISLDKELLQLVQGACKADNLQRALDLTRLMHNPGSVDAAAKIAGFYHLPGLQERMGGVVVKKKKVEHYLTRYGNGNGNGSGSGEREKTKGFNDFAPRNNRRSFGGKVRDRDSTPANGGNGTYIPETPRTELESTPLEDSVMGSPEGKRKRDEEEFEPVRKIESSFKGMSFSPRLAFLLLEYSGFCCARVRLTCRTSKEPIRKETTSF